MNKVFTSVVAIGVILSLTITSCKSSKSATRSNGKVENLTSNKIVDSVSRYCFHYEYFTSRIATEFTISGEKGKEDVSKSFKTHLKMRTDSAIWMTFSVANIIGANALITLDSVKVVNKMDKQYFLGDFNYINEMFGTELDYYMVQDLLIGNLINFEHDAKYKVKEDTAFYIISTVGRRRMRKAFDNERMQKKEPFIYRYWIYPGTFRPAKTIINDLSDTTELQVEYLNYEIADSLLVPSELRVTVTTPRKKAVLNLNYSRTKVNEFTEFPFKIPEGYEKME